MGVLDCRYTWLCSWTPHAAYTEGARKERESRWAGNIPVGLKTSILFILSQKLNLR